MFKTQSTIKQLNLTQNIRESFNTLNVLRMILVMEVKRAVQIY